MSRRLIERLDGQHFTAKIYKDNVWNEYRVTLVNTQTCETESTYHTDDLEDARQTGKAMAVVGW